MSLAYRRIKKSEVPYATQLALNEINIRPKRLSDHNTILIYHNGQRIGFVSFRYKFDQTVYIYVLALEKDAQRQGYASEVFESLMKYGRKKDERFRGLSATIHKVNVQAINAATKHGFLVTGERARHLEFTKPVTDERENRS